MREKFAKWLFGYLVGWSFFVIAIAVFQGFSLLGFHLESTVLSVLFGTTSASVIGLMLAILRGLFSPKP